MNRYRWYGAKWPFSMEQLARRLRSKNYSAAVMSGFVLDKVRNDIVEGRFVERLEIVDEVVDPFGNKQSFKRVEYRESDFLASSIWPGLELKDPPRSTQGLISALCSAADFNLTITPLSLSVLDWIDYYKVESGVEGFVDSIQIGGLELEKGVTSKMLIKGRKDILQNVHEMILGKKHTIEKARFRIGSNSGCYILFSKGAGVSLKVNKRVSVVTDIRASLNKLLLG